MPPKDAIRFKLNRFVEGKADDLVPMTTWAGLRVAKGAPWPTGSPLYFAIDAPFGFETAVIAAATKEGELTRTRLVAGWANPSPTIARIANACSALYAKHSPSSFVVDGYSGKLIAAELKRRGLPVIVTSQGDVLALSAIFYAKVSTGKLAHEGDELLTMQLPSAQRKTIGEAWRIVGRRGSAFGIDAVMSTAAAVWAVETHQEVGMQLF
jgi:phage terminase large subunit-like protein